MLQIDWQAVLGNKISTDDRPSDIGQAEAPGERLLLTEVD